MVEEVVKEAGAWRQFLSEASSGVFSVALVMLSLLWYSKRGRREDDDGAPRVTDWASHEHLETRMGKVENRVTALETAFRSLTESIDRNEATFHRMEDKLDQVLLNRGGK